MQAFANRKAWLVSAMLSLLVVLFSARAMASNPPGAKSPQSAPAQGEFVGQEVCATCHDDVAKGFSSNPHSKLAQMHGKSGVT